jgi:3-deoxy-manno-octulosonate cytidylyltransferase (CMP-KDO synthetase)
MLLELAGKPMIQHVYERAAESGADRVIIATDNQSIVDAIRKINAEVVLTSESHRSGTERIAEVVQKMELEDSSIIVNVQGDEPLIEPEIIKNVANNLAEHQKASIATVATPITVSEEFYNPNVVKVVMDSDNCALYFSRAPIPWPRDFYIGKEFSELKSLELPQTDITFYRHIGIYAYSAEFVKTYVRLPQSKLEKVEALEQLRALSNGYRISVLITSKSSGFGVDTQEDFDKVKEIIERC